MDRIQVITAACYAAWYAYAVIGLGEEGEPWEAAPEWRKSCLRHNVRFWEELPEGLPFEELCAASHVAWMNFSKREGWSHGDVKCFEKRTHPNLVPYGELPSCERKKDVVVVQAYLTMRGVLGPP